MPMKVILILLPFYVLNLIAGLIIYSLNLELYTNILFVLIHALCLSISIMIGIIIVKKFKWNLYDTGIRGIQKNTLKNVFYLIPFFIIVMLSLLTGFRDNETNVGILNILLLLIIHYIVVSLHEEFYFRGILLSLFKDNINKAILISSFIFGAGHFVNIVTAFFDDLILSEFLLSTLIQVIFAFIIGIVYAGTVLITKSIIPAILFHTIWNFIATITNGSTIISVIQTILLMIYGIVMWIKIKKNPNCT
jgi:membrane protease YdiL (CAAX protease family)